MNEEKLKKSMNKYLENIRNVGEIEAINERSMREEYYKSWNKEKIKNISEEEFYKYISQLWAIGMWGNKQYFVNKIIYDNGFEKIKNNLAELLFGDNTIEERWDNFKNEIKGFGPAMMSEILCYTYPNEYMLWNRTAVEAFSYLEIKNIPIHNYQFTGKKYIELCSYAKKIRDEFIKQGYKNTDLLFVDYFFWDELRNIPINQDEVTIQKDKKLSVTNNKSYHDEIVEDIKNIGIMLGYNTSNSGRITNSGKIPDAVWEFNVGNIGQIKYVFEVQDNGHIDSLIVSLMNASQDISVQAVIAISDDKQIEKIKLHCKNIEDRFNGKLKFWNISDVERASEGLTTAMEIINNTLNITK